MPQGALPLLKVVTDEAEFSMRPVWAFAFWILTPAAASIVWKRFVGDQKGGELNESEAEEK